MEKPEQKDRERIDAVLKILRKQAPLTVKQEKFCNDACVERFLKAKCDSVKKAAKQLRSVLSWRETLGTDHLIADEFSAELAEGAAYVAGQDSECRPVVIFRIKQDYSKSHTQKSFVRLVVFTLEVAVLSMCRFVDQFVLLFDASFFRSASAFLNLVMGTMKLLADYYPGRLNKAFVIDPPSMFPYLWKGVRPFVELSPVTVIVSTLELEEAMAADDNFTLYPRTASLRYDSPATVGSKSSRFSFTVSHMDALKPWYLSTNTTTTRTQVLPTTTTRTQVLPTTTNSPSLVGASNLTARSFSFASPGARSTPINRSIPSTPLSNKPQRRNQNNPPPPQQPRTPRPSFLPSPAAIFSSLRRDSGQNQQGSSRVEKERESILPYMRFYRRPYDEIVYRAKMRPPLGGLISIVNPQLNSSKQRRHVSFYQRI